MIGSVIGSYRIVQKLGEGGMGSVYKALDLMLEREVALKILRPEFSGQSELAERFRTEAVTLARLNHPNIATLYGLARENERLFMVMEFVTGETLEQVLEQQRRLPPVTAVWWTCQVLDAMEYAHRRGVVHRDIKPANLMVTDEGAIKVMDFGIARVLGTAHQTQLGHIIGTASYMAPEQIHGEEVDGRADLYAMGVVLYQLVTGQTPFQGDDFSVLTAHVSQTPTPPSTIVPDLPPWLDSAIGQVLAKAPADRPSTATQLRRALETGLRELGETVPTGKAPTGDMVAEAPTFMMDRRPGSITGSGSRSAELPPTLVPPVPVARPTPAVGRSPEPSRGSAARAVVVPPSVPPTPAITPPPLPLGATASVPVQPGAAPAVPPAVPPKAPGSSAKPRTDNGRRWQPTWRHYAGVGVAAVALLAVLIWAGSRSSSPTESPVPEVTSSPVTSGPPAVPSAAPQAPAATTAVPDVRPPVSQPAAASTGPAQGGSQPAATRGQPVAASQPSNTKVPAQARPASQAPVRPASDAVRGAAPAAREPARAEQDEEAAKKATKPADEPAAKPEDKAKDKKDKAGSKAEKPTVFEGVHLLKDEASETAVNLNFFKDHFTLSAEGDDAALHTVRYQSVTGVDYVETRQAKAPAKGGLGAIKGVLSKGTRLFGAGKHWLTISAGGSTLVLRVGRPYRDIIAIIEQRSGIKAKMTQ